MTKYYLQNEYLCADSAALNSALVEDDDYVFQLNCEVDNSQVCNMEGVAECSHNLPKCKVSGSTSSQNAFMHITILIACYTVFLCKKHRRRYSLH